MYILIVFSVLIASINSVLLKKTRLNEKTELFKFNLCTALIWCIVLFITNKGQLYLNASIWMWGMVYGLAQSFFIFFKAAAMNTGAVSVTTLIGNSSLFVSIFASLIIWKEKVTVMDLLGLLLLGVAIFLCTYKKSETSYTASWKYYAVLFLVFAASVGIIFKGFGKSGNLEHCGDMMLVAALTMVVFYTVACGLMGGWNFKQTFGAQSREKQKEFIGFAVGSGILSCLYNRLNIFLSGSMDAVIFFPAFNGGVVLVSALLGVLFCKERLSKKQVAGIGIGILAIVVIGIL